MGLPRKDRQPCWDRSKWKQAGRMQAAKQCMGSHVSSGGTPTWANLGSLQPSSLPTSESWAGIREGVLGSQLGARALPNPNILPCIASLLLAEQGSLGVIVYDICGPAIAHIGRDAPADEEVWLGFAIAQESWLGLAIDREHILRIGRSPTSSALEVPPHLRCSDQPAPSAKADTTGNRTGPSGLNRLGRCYRRGRVTKGKQRRTGGPGGHDCRTEKFWIFLGASHHRRDAPRLSLLDFRHGDVGH